MSLRNFPNHGTSYTRLPVSSSLSVLRIIKKPIRKCKEDNSDPYLAMLALHATKNSSGTSASELLMKRKLQTLVPLQNVTVNTKTKLKKQNVCQSRELQPLNTNDTVRYCQNNNWARTGIIPNKNDIMPQSYTLLKDKDKVIRRNRLFADDTSLFSVVQNMTKSANELNNNLAKISTWVFQWKMNFNPDPNKQAQEVIFS